MKACRHAQCKALPDSDHVLRCQAPEVRGSPDLPAMLAPTLGSSRFAGSTCPLHSAPVCSRPHRLLPQRIECKESRVGRAPIAIPSGVNVTNSGLTYTVKVSHLGAAARGVSAAPLLQTICCCKPHLTKSTVSLQGPKGELERTFSPLVRIETLVGTQHHALVQLECQTPQGSGCSTKVLLPGGWSPSALEEQRHQEVSHVPRALTVR